MHVGNKKAWNNRQKSREKKIDGWEENRRWQRVGTRVGREWSGMCVMKKRGPYNTHAATAAGGCYSSAAETLGPRNDFTGITPAKSGRYGAAKCDVAIRHSRGLYVRTWWTVRPTDAATLQGLPGDSSLVVSFAFPFLSRISVLHKWWFPRIQFLRIHDVTTIMDLSLRSVFPFLLKNYLLLHVINTICVNSHDLQKRFLCIFIKIFYRIIV